LKDIDDTKKERYESFSSQILPSLRKQLKKIAQREGRSISMILEEQLINYIKIHGSGNPVFKLDNWKDPDFKICPAYLVENNIWKEYIQNCNKEELQQLEEKAQTIVHFTQKKFRYGDVNAQTF